MSAARTIPPEEVQLARMNYRPPDVKQGETIVWYRTGARGPHSMIGYVVRVNGRTVDLMLAGGKMSYNVRHVDDPQMDIAEMREPGGWEHSEATLAVRRACEMIESADVDVQTLRAAVIGHRDAVRKNRETEVAFEQFREQVATKLDAMQASIDSLLAEKKKPAKAGN